MNSQYKLSTDVETRTNEILFIQYLERRKLRGVLDWVVINNSAANATYRNNARLLNVTRLALQIYTAESTTVSLNSVTELIVAGLFHDFDFVNGVTDEGDNAQRAIAGYRRLQVDLRDGVVYGFDRRSKLFDILNPHTGSSWRIEQLIRGTAYSKRPIGFDAPSNSPLAALSDATFLYAFTGLGGRLAQKSVHEELNEVCALVGSEPVTDSEFRYIQRQRIAGMADKLLTTCGKEIYRHSCQLLIDEISKY